MLRVYGGLGLGVYWGVRVRNKGFGIRVIWVAVKKLSLNYFSKETLRIIPTCP